MNCSETFSQCACCKLYRALISSGKCLVIFQGAFASIIARDSFFCPEIEIFYAVKQWHRLHSQEEEANWIPHEDIVSKVRLTLMSIQELLKAVRHSNLFDLNHLMDAIESISDENKLKIHLNEENGHTPIDTKDLPVIRKKNYRGRLSKFL
jgi:hypothetical protein